MLARFGYLPRQVINKGRQPKLAVQPTTLHRHPFSAQKTLHCIFMHNYFISSRYISRDRVSKTLQPSYLRKLINVTVGERNVPFCTASLRGTHSTLHYSLLSGISSLLRRIRLIMRFRHIIPINSDCPTSCKQALSVVLCARFQHSLSLLQRHGFAVTGNS